MASDQEAAPARPAAFELKGTVASLTVIRLLVPELSRVEAQLGVQVAQLPRFFEQAPVVVDLEALGEAAARVELGELAALLRRHRLVPVALRHLAVEREAEAASAGFGLLRGPAARGMGGAAEAPASVGASAEAPAPTARAARGTAASAPAEAQAHDATPPPPSGTRPRAVAEPAPLPAVLATAEALGGMLLTQPARGGQVIYAAQRDLVLLAPVNAGAELIADGHIHVYGALRGRALAGAHGNQAARIFCSSLEAELVSIAGEYLPADRLPERFRGKPTQIHLQDGELIFRPL
ncbi:MAG: septum site-determining protein MinC [Proteobacteria bacterium]|nr:septum site-determining protein MinC [Pseudomonadota bacterium]